MASEKVKKDKDKELTYERKASKKNGVTRMAFAVIAIAIEIVLIFMLLTALSRVATWIEVILHILALVLVFWLYAKNITAAMKMPWIILILSLPIVGTILYLLIGMNSGTHRMRMRYEEVDRHLLPLLSGKDDETIERLKQTDMDAAQIATYLRNHSSYPVWQNTDVVYFDDAAKGLEAQLVDLEKAQKFIFMEYHAIDNEVCWNRIEEVLARKVAQGVEVRVFYDDMGSIGFITTDFVKKLRSRGIACSVFNPFMPILNLFINNRDHRKVTVIDGKVGYTGGYNLADEYFHLTKPYGQWKDTGVRLQGDAVQALTVTFLEMWNAGRVGKGEKTDISFLPYLPEYQYKAVQKGFVQPYADSPLDDKRIGEDVYISMAEKATRYCYFVTPYLVLTDEMTRAISLAARRGVDVRIVTPGIPDKKLVYSVTRSYYPELAKSGVRIYEWTPGFCHCKMSVADDKIATCGTINMDYRSLYHHFENGCCFYDPNIAVQIRDDIRSMFAESREVTKEYSEGEKASLPVSQLVLRLFVELL
jgi:cardiolipin synthase